MMHLHEVNAESTGADVQDGSWGRWRGAGMDISDRVPREVTFQEIQRSDSVITRDCSADDVCPAGWGGAARDWELPDPGGRPVPAVSRIRDEIQTCVSALCTKLQTR